MATGTFAKFLLVASSLTIAAPPAVLGLTVDQARENCRASVGRPLVQACIRSGGDRESCRAKATPSVRDCIKSAMDKANGRANVAIEAPKEEGPSDDITKQAEEVATVFVAPPRTITDITAIIDSEKPDPERIAELRAAADAPIPTKGTNEKLARAYYERGNARAELGRLSEAIADGEKAIEVSRGISANQRGRLEQFLGLQYAAAGDPTKALEIFQRQIRVANAPGAKGFLFGGYRQIARFLIQMGDITQAEAYLRRSQALIQEARTSGLPGWRSSYAALGQSWESDVESLRAIIFEARGQYREAEKSYRLAELRKRASVKGILSRPNPPPESQILAAADVMVIGQARTKAKQGRLAEAEADARRALLARLKDQGKYNPTTPRYMMGLVSSLVEQGRYLEAEQLVRTAIEINRTIGVTEESQFAAELLSRLASILNLQGKRRDASATYEELDKVVAKWNSKRREVFDLNSMRILSLYSSGEYERGIAAAQALVKRNVQRVGEKNYDTAVARGVLAIGFMRTKHDADAIREFRAAIPLLMTGSHENSDTEKTTVVAARSQRLRNIVEEYIVLLNRQTADGDAAATETFALADAIRGQSVQQALAASSARMAAKDPALAELVREQQDLAKQVNAQLGNLNNMLELPSGQRDDNAVKIVTALINKLRSDRDRKSAEITKRFPSYVDLIDPKPPSVADIKTTLKADEALLSFYFGRDHSFVWAVPKFGKVAFAEIQATPGEIETKVRKLREALEPQAAMISDIPPFDLNLAYGVYSLLLKPVEAGWRPAKNLIVVTNGALGLLPLSILPTAGADALDGDGPLFSGYRKVPWLARSHAVTLVPSAAALRTLRQIPPGSENRARMIGFGDPIFSKEQAAELATKKASQQAAQLAMGNTTRGLPLRRRSSPKLEGVDSADLAMLPPLPDTAEELNSIAVALESDPAKVLQLGVKANEQTVKTANLSHYKILVFATHGLVPGELNGLTQPALALSAPDVAGVGGDGLLTMEEILALKLDADWVVLSACNTGAGAGAGAEAASGLGRAFFYAGTRAILVTNWSVHSQSARELVADLFRRQAGNAKLTRGEVLQQAMMVLLDGKGFTDENGKTLFAYAHPLFWAPYTIIGDGG
jgi:CHAT domain-containing protein